MGLFFFKERKPKRFEYKPFYYNPEKEKHEERLQRIKAEIGIEDETDKKIAYKPSRYISFKKQKPAKTKTSKIKGLIIIIAFGLLILMLYLISVYTKYIVKNG